MADKIPVIPTLMTSTSRLVKPMDIIQYVLRTYMFWPKNISDTFNHREVSFIYDVAAVGWSEEFLKERVGASLRNVLGYYFQTFDLFEVDVITEREDDVYYNVKIDIMVAINGVTYRFESTQKVDKDGHLIYQFDGTD